MRHLVIAAAGLLAACGSSEKSTTIGGATFSTDGDKGSARITTSEGTLKTSEGAAAASVTMPDFAPRYPGASISAVLESESGGKKTKMVTFATADPVEKVFAFYKTALTSKGWKLKQSLSGGEGGQSVAMGGAEKDGREVSFTIARSEEGKTEAVINVPGD